MYTCPACGSDKAAGKSTCKCGADLSVLQCLEAQIDGWFNEALDALARDERGKALEWLAACCTASPSDAAARRALAKVWARLGHVQEARRCLDLSMENDPDHPDVALIASALDSMVNGIGGTEERPVGESLKAPEESAAIRAGLSALETAAALARTAATTGSRVVMKRPAPRRRVARSDGVTQLSDRQPKGSKK